MHPLPATAHTFFAAAHVCYCVAVAAFDAAAGSAAVTAPIEGAATVQDAAAAVVATAAVSTLAAVATAAE